MTLWVGRNHTTHATRDPVKFCPWSFFHQQDVDHHFNTSSTNIPPKTYQVTSSFLQETSGEFKTETWWFLQTIVSFRGPVFSGEPAVRFQGCALPKTNSSPVKIGQNIGTGNYNHLPNHPILRWTNCSFREVFSKNWQKNIEFTWKLGWFSYGFLPFWGPRIPFPTRPHLHGVAIACGRQAPDRVVVRVLGILQASYRAVVAAGDVIRKRRQGLGWMASPDFLGRWKLCCHVFFFQISEIFLHFFGNKERTIEGKQLKSQKEDNSYTFVPKTWR